MTTPVAPLRKVLALDFDADAMAPVIAAAGHDVQAVWERP